MKRTIIVKSLLVTGALVPAALGFQSIESTKERASKRQPAVDAALMHVMDAGDAWIKEKKCVSCHMIPGMLWSLSEARKQGFSVPDDQYRQWVDWSLADVVRESPGSEGLSQVVLADVEHRDAKAKLEAFAKTLLEKQAADGSWRPGGQTPQQKRPFPESKETVTMWSMLALDKVLGKKASPAIARGLASLTGPEGKRSSEWHTLRLLVAQRTGDDTMSKDQIERLLKSQHKDGGWSWLLDDESDAIATGQTLYALSFAPRKQVREALSKGREFLKKTQRSDGSWAVKGTLSQDRSKVLPTSVYWGTTWAVIGLCRTEEAKR